MYKKKLALLLATILTLTGCQNVQNNKNEKYDAITLEQLETTIPKPESTLEPTNLPENVSSTVYDILNDKINYEFGYIKENTKVYNVLDNSILDNIEKYQKVIVLSKNEKYSVVQTESNLIGNINNEYIGTLPDTFVEIDLSEQKVIFYIDNEIAIKSDIVTGHASNSPTRLGYFEIYYKETDCYLTGPGYRSHVDYWMPFDKGIGLHDADWRDEFGKEIYKNNGSHGCVNMPFDTAKTIYNNTEVHSKVLVHN